MKNFDLGYRNGTSVAILNLHVATMPLTKFQLIPIYGAGGDVENAKKLTTDDGQQATHKLTWSKAPGELIM